MKTSLGRKCYVVFKESNLASSLASSFWVKCSNRARPSTLFRAEIINCLSSSFSESATACGEFINAFNDAVRFWAALCDEPIFCAALFWASRRGLLSFRGGGCSKESAKEGRAETRGGELGLLDRTGLTLRDRLDAVFWNTRRTALLGVGDGERIRSGLATLLSLESWSLAIFSPGGDKSTLGYSLTGFVRASLSSLTSTTSLDPITCRPAEARPERGSPNPHKQATISPESRLNARIHLFDPVPTSKSGSPYC